MSTPTIEIYTTPKASLRIDHGPRPRVWVTLAGTTYSVGWLPVSRQMAVTHKGKECPPEIDAEVFQAARTCLEKGARAAWLEPGVPVPEVHAANRRVKVEISANHRIYTRTPYKVEVFIDGERVNYIECATGTSAKRQATMAFKSESKRLGL